MKPSSHDQDRLLHVLTEETRALPHAAAAHARAHRKRRARTVSLTLAATILALFAGVWISKSKRSQVKSGSLALIVPVSSEESRSSQGYVRVYTVENDSQAHQSNVTSGREAQLLAELPGVPVLLVKNEAGQIDRIHIFER
jgi:hypothetical protein